MKPAAALAATELIDEFANELDKTFALSDHFNDNDFDIFLAFRLHELGDESEARLNRQDLPTALIPNLKAEFARYENLINLTV